MKPEAKAESEKAENGNQTEMFQEHPDATALRELLAAGHWLSRALIATTLRWHPRRVPAAAELLGPEIVRSRTHGFKLTALLTREEIPIALHAAAEMHSQAKKNEGCALALKQRVHRLIS